MLHRGRRRWRGARWTSGFYVSFAGILTFPKADDIREAARLVPADRLLVETDSPYLAPVPFRGKRNEPAHVARVLEVLAELRGDPLRALTEQTARLRAALRSGPAWAMRQLATRQRLSALTLTRKSSIVSGQPDDIHLTDTAQNSPVTADLAQIFEPIREDLDRVEQEFVRHIQSRVALIPEMGRYIQKSGGKRVRPAVLLMAARLCGYTGDRAVLNASVVEFIHTATLVHDDIIDGADLRRGRLAVHSRWGNDITVLLGDYLYIKSMAMALTQDSLEIIRLLCDVTLRMIEGELYQLTKTGDVDITEEEHFEIIRRKTAYLFGGCAQIGGMLGERHARAAARAARVRVQPRHRLPARRRSARLHGRRDGARQARRRRPARRQGHAADHLPAAARRRRRRSPDPRRRPGPGGHDRAVARDRPPAPRTPDTSARVRASSSPTIRSAVGVEMEGPADPGGDVAEVAEGGREEADADLGGGRGAGADRLARSLPGGRAGRAARRSRGRGLFFVSKTFTTPFLHSSIQPSVP